MPVHEERDTQQDHISISRYDGEVRSVCPQALLRALYGGVARYSADNCSIVRLRPAIKRGTPVTPAERSARARIAALSIHAQGKTNTSRARATFLARFEASVDPERRLSDRDRNIRAELARKAYFAKLARRSAEKRRATMQGG